MVVQFSEIPEVLEELRKGKMIVLVDAEDRENEGDLVCAAEKVTPEIINFMAKNGRGLICLPLTAEKCDSLGLIHRRLRIPHGLGRPLRSVLTLLRV